jgi:hypothetical protein
MSWFLTILTAVVTGVLGLVCGGLLGNACVRWYHIRHFEGEAGY